MRGPDYSAVELLARLVAFDTTSHKSNLGIVAFIEDYLAQHGIRAELVPSADGQKASLYATIGPQGIAGIGLSGHTDVVPVDGQAWLSEPFTLTERDGKLYGRGTTDMKGFLACVLASVPLFKAAKLKIPIHILFSYDEEIGCIGVRPMIGEFGKRLQRPRCVIVGEPTGMGVVDAHKGPVRWKVTVQGRAAHSSMAPLGVNAVTYAARMIAELERMETRLKAAPRDSRFDPPYATLQVTGISGGTASNIIPVSCQFGFEVRALPGLDIAAVEAGLRKFARERCIPEMRKTAPEACIDIELVNMVPPFAADADSEVVGLALSLAQANETFAVSYATEAGLFQDGGAPAVVCGPGSIAQAHTANEWISKEQIAQCMAFMERVARWAEQ